MPSTLITTMLTGLPTVSTTALLCAGLAGLAVLLALRRPAGQLRRITPRKSRLAVAVTPVVRLLRGRADAPPLVRRVLLSLACILALGVAGARIDGWLGAWSGSRCRWLPQPACWRLAGSSRGQPAAGDSS